MIRMAPNDQLFCDKVFFKFILDIKIMSEGLKDSNINIILNRSAF